MKAIELVGKLAIRTKPSELGINDYSGERNCDYSYTTTPIRIIKVTENHIIYNHKGTGEGSLFGKDKYILDSRWLDDNWTDYQELVKVK
jgi:hypothetical protein